VAEPKPQGATSFRIELEAQPKPDDAALTALAPNLMFTKQNNHKKERGQLALGRSQSHSKIFTLSRRNDADPQH
jgi:hypothetical protein